MFRRQGFGYYFALGIVFLFVMTIISSRFVERVGALNMFRAGLWIPVCDGGVDGFQRADGRHWILGAGGRRCGVCRLCVDGFVEMRWRSFWMSFRIWRNSVFVGGHFRFGIGAIVGALLSLAAFTSAWPMIWSIALCAAVHSVLSLRQPSKTVMTGALPLKWREKNAQAALGTLIHYVRKRLSWLIISITNSSFFLLYVYFM